MINLNDETDLTFSSSSFGVKGEDVLVQTHAHFSLSTPWDKLVLPVLRNAEMAVRMPDMILFKACSRLLRLKLHSLLALAEVNTCVLDSF